MGDLNAREGNYNISNSHSRKTKDLTVNAKGRKLIDILNSFDLGSWL
jgi:hypothetical protein